jgi:hypothetical protein
MLRIEECVKITGCHLAGDKACVRPVSGNPKATRSVARFFNLVLLGVVWIVVGIWLIWGFGAIWFDFPLTEWSTHAAGGFAVLCLAAVIVLRGGWRAVGVNVVLAGLVTAGWWMLKPLQYRDWKPEVALVPWAEVKGDVVTIHHVRNFEYRTKDDFDVRHEQRQYRMSQLRGVDLFLNYWGSPLMAHPILSFDFGPDGRVCFSVETRPERGEAYSALRGLYRGFELICIVADERDVVRVRSNYRDGEDVYLYRLRMADPKTAFLEYMEMLNRLRAAPKWYNAITQNCTTSLRSQRSRENRAAWDWRMLVNGYFDELLYEREQIDASLPFAELRRASLINERARAADADPEFSSRIREGLPGFE